MTKYFDKKITEAGAKNEIVLKDKDPEIFKMFYDWMYTVGLRSYVL